MKNIYKALPPLKGERFRRLLKLKNVVIEEIVSSGKIKDKVYIQRQDEWAVIIRGGANLRLGNRTVKMKRGDSVFIKKGLRHQILNVRGGTIWLAVHVF
jgi:mannose-6-phosphate isomerase-like protein (cupin superfamily)